MYGTFSLPIILARHFRTVHWVDKKCTDIWLTAGWWWDGPVFVHPLLVETRVMLIKCPVSGKDRLNGEYERWHINWPVKNSGFRHSVKNNDSLQRATTEVTRWRYNRETTMKISLWLYLSSLANILLVCEVYTHCTKFSFYFFTILT